MAEKPTDQVGWSIRNWAARYDIPRSSAYALIASGKGPKVSKLPGMSKSIITLEADIEWRKRLNEAAA